MSHTGDVIRPSKSPGLIRVLTAGYKVRQKDEVLELVFRKPSVRERFVVFDTLHSNTGSDEISFGKGVKFNLRRIEEAELLWGKGYNKEIRDMLKEVKVTWLTQIKERIECLEDDDPYKDHLEEKLIHIKNLDFELTYLATNVLPVEDDSILKPFYNFLEDLDIESGDTIINQLEKLPVFDYEGDLLVNVLDDILPIRRVRILDPDAFDRITDYVIADVGDVDEDIRNLKQHPITTYVEMPTKVDHVKRRK